MCGWLFPGPVICVFAGAPLPFAICAAVWPLPYRFEASGLEDLSDVHVAEPPCPPPVEHDVFLSVVSLGLMPACESDELFWADSAF